MENTKNLLNQQFNQPFTFRPHRLVRSTLIQTSFPSILYRATQSHQLNARSQEMIFTDEAGIRLQGFYTPQTEQPAKGLILMIHGWLGSANSPYSINICNRLFERGYAIFRLNLRDHGGTHHLNPEPFRGDQLDEVFSATQKIAQIAPDLPLHIIGVSLGGNFALRLAARHSHTPIANLTQAIAICPVIHGYHSVQALDKGSFVYLNYFRRKWRKSMRVKQDTYPQVHDWSATLAASSCLGMHEQFVAECTPHPNPFSYFQAYSITTSMVQTLTVPTTILAARDDSIVPVADFAPLAGLNPQLHIDIQPHGGHVGFFDIFPFRIWLLEAIEQILATHRS